MKTKIKLKVMKLSDGKYTETFNTALETQIRQAARAWLRTVITRVPVYSGMARGSLIPLGQYLRVAIPIHPTESSKRHGYKKDRISEGEAKGGFDFSKTKTLFKFHFSTDVAHYQFNEFNDPRPIIKLQHEPIPWHSMEAGRESFDQYLAENLPDKIPKLSKYIVSEEIS
jgi:hypothetical protein